MKRNVSSLIGFTMGATDGEIGTVKDFYFDDMSWTIRYLIVETGKLLSERKVLISPQSVLLPDWENKKFPVNLTMEKVRNSPDIDTEKPVFRQQEIKLYSHYPWSVYWTGGRTGMPPVSMYQVFESVEDDSNSPEGDPHLQSTDEVTGYDIKAIDGGIGEVEDFIIDDLTWKIDFMVIDTGKWLPGKKVLISPSLIKDISWKLSGVMVSSTVEDIKHSPEYDPKKPVDEVYASMLTEHYNGVAKTRN